MLLVCGKVKDWLAPRLKSPTELVPFPVRRKSGKPILGQDVITYWLILNIPLVDCIDVDNTAFQYGMGRDGLAKGRGLSDDGPIALKHDAVQGLTLWRGVDFWQRYLFCSSDFREYCATEKIRGLEFSLKCTLK